MEGTNIFKDFTDGQKLKTVNSNELLVHVSKNGVAVNGATSQEKDLYADNGIVHSLDTVLASK